MRLQAFFQGRYPDNTSLRLFPFPWPISSRIRLRRRRFHLLFTVSTYSTVAPLAAAAVSASVIKSGQSLDRYGRRIFTFPFYDGISISGRNHEAGFPEEIPLSMVTLRVSMKSLLTQTTLYTPSGKLVNSAVNGTPFLPFRRAGQHRVALPDGNDGGPFRTPRYISLDSAFGRYPGR